MINTAYLPEFSRKKFTPLLVTLIFVTYTLVCFGFYLERTLKGEINNHILAGDMFGVPTELRERGIRPLYFGEGQTGWDGQFYYYMANDLLGTKDTTEHIDAPSYRYQRIGMSLYAAITSKAFLNDWVSPTWYFCSYFVLLISATFVGALTFRSINASPAWVLLWALSPGTQFTFFNALPDAAADAFLILGIAALLSGRYALAVVPLTFAALSREVYALFPSAILLFHLMEKLREVDWREKIPASIKARELLSWHKSYLLIIPGIIAVFWQLYVISHFGTHPSEQAHGILGMPFSAWHRYLISGMSGHHELVGTGFSAYAEAASLLAFLGVLMLAMLSALPLLRKQKSLDSNLLMGIALALCLLVVIYACFGPTVMMHYTGYFKAAASFFFLIPLLLLLGGAKKYTLWSASIFLGASLAIVSDYNLRTRVLSTNDFNNFEEYTNRQKVVDTRRVECLEDYRFKSEILGIEMRGGGLLSHIFGSGDHLVVRTKLTNLSAKDFVSTRNFGSIHMSYHWVDSNGSVILDGIRSAIPEKIKPGQSVEISIVSPLPPAEVSPILKLSPVQEGCAWFYLSGDN